jgi:hypothetical protein
VHKMSLIFFVVILRVEGFLELLYVVMCDMLWYCIVLYCIALYGIVLS